MVAPIGPIQVAGVGGAGGATRVGSAGTSSAPVDKAQGAGFGQAVGDALSKVGAQEVSVQKAAEAAATGDLRSVSDYMIAATEAQLTTQITVAVRDRALSAFNDIMRMQI
jgi:flagellar hook-basal body complex protein FliE